VALSNVYTTNIYNVPAASGGVGNSFTPYAVLRHIHVVNKATTATFRLFLGATGGNVAGSELAFDVSVATGGVWDWYGLMRVDAADFLVGGASAAATLGITVWGEIGG
jgi:hypothetical protein